VLGAAPAPCACGGNPHSHHRAEGPLLLGVNVGVLRQGAGLAAERDDPLISALALATELLFVDFFRHLGLPCSSGSCQHTPLSNHARAIVINCFGRYNYGCMGTLSYLWPAIRRDTRESASLPAVVDHLARRLSPWTRQPLSSTKAKANDIE
jgi:hypothetical protein